MYAIVYKSDGFPICRQMEGISPDPVVTWNTEAAAKAFISGKGGGADFQLLDWKPDTHTWSVSDVDVGGMTRGMTGNIKGMVAGQFTRAAPEGTELALLGPGLRFHAGS